MAEPTEPQSPADPNAVQTTDTVTDPAAEPVVVEPVSASEHVGVEPDVPVVEEEVEEVEIVDDVADPVTVEPAAVEPVTVEPVTVEPVTVEPVTVEDTASPAQPVVPPAEVQREVVYVQAPTPPKERGNRGFGVLIAILGAVAFGLLYLAVAVVLSLLAGTGFTASIPVFLASDAYWVPIAAYAVFAVIFALIVNRAAWWAHIIASIFVALLTYVASVGVLALLRDVVGMTADSGLSLIAAMAASPLLLSVLLLARETNLWFGLAISTRGRRVKERNAAARAEFEESLARQRAENERTYPAV